MTETPTPNVIEYLSKKFGTQTRLAAAAGIRQHTMSERKAVNSLSHDQMRRIMRAGPDMGVEITPYDFFPEIPAPEKAKVLRAKKLGRGEPATPP